RRTWPLWLGVVAVAEIAVDLTHGQSGGMAAGFAAANVVEPLVGAIALAWVSHRMPTMRRQLFGFVACAGALGPVFGAAVGATTSTVVGGASGWFSIAGKWWLGDALGVLVVATPILAWSRRAHTENECPPIEAVGITVAATLVTILPALWWRQPTLYAVLPVLVLAAFRGGVRAVSLAGVGVAFAADWVAVSGRANALIAQATPEAQLLFVQLFLGVTLLTSLTMAVEVAERRRAERVGRRAEAERIRAELSAADAADLERRRIAQETHDIVGHALNVMLLQAGAARRVIDEDTGQSRQLLQSLEDVGRHAFGDLDAALGLADAPPDGVANLGLASVPSLVDVMRGAGMSVDLVVDGDSSTPVSTLVDWSGYRIVQESLTNAAKHAANAHVEVWVRYEPDVVEISVVDDGAGAVPERDTPPGFGRGLIGMRERVAVLGGDIDIGPNRGAGFVVRARLPMPSKT
ncbi:MAG: MASE1 domain-containing protein, partial [Acidimicrobiia bacterium]|nr:MASE1 domain-containing protein [Acidimicrobiia bacterium]